MQCTEQVEHAGFLDKERELGKVLTCTRESSANDVWNCKQEIKKKRSFVMFSEDLSSLCNIYYHICDQFACMTAFNWDIMTARGIKSTVGWISLSFWLVLTGTEIVVSQYVISW